jgi:hypothetical protein
MSGGASQGFGDRIVTFLPNSGQVPGGRRPVRSHAKLPRTPGNFLCDLRLTSEPRLSMDSKNPVYAAEWRLRHGERTWRMEVPRAVPHGRESEELCTFQEL